MSTKIFGYTVAFLVLCIFCGKNSSTPILEYDKGLRYEEYMIEHEISTMQARNSALSMDYSSFTHPPRCQPCTKAEKTYCLSSDFISDHCCCDKRYHELLPFVPHTCYIGGPQSCTTVIRGGCPEYHSLRTCCCDKYVLEKWKKKFGSSRARRKSALLSLVTLLISMYIFVY